MKKLFVNFLIWIVGCAIVACLLTWELERNPIAPNADGSISDSASLPLFVFAILFLLMIISINLILWMKSRFYSKQ